MRQIRPFAAIRYAAGGERDISALVAPPYDILDEKGKAALQARHPDNIVTIDLPYLPHGTTGPDEAYESAGRTLRQWLARGVLASDARPAFYVCRQSWQGAGGQVCRTGFFAQVRLAPFEARRVIPHERVFPAPIQDRLRLMRTTGAQLSAIFGLYSDPGDEVCAALAAGRGRPDITATLDGVRNELWVAAEDARCELAASIFGQRPVYIADGHHRYTTALRYRDEVAAAHGGSLPEEHPANWCMFMLVRMEDPGLRVLPTHRVVGGLDGFDARAFAQAVAGRFRVERLPDAAGALRSLAVNADRPAPAMWLFDGRSRELHEMRLEDADVLRALEPQRCDEWRRLDVAILHRYVLDEVVRPAFAAGRELRIAYTHDVDEAAGMCDGSDYQIAFLLRPTPVEALRKLGDAGELMPQKSTYFYPKVATGLVIGPLR